MIIHSAVPYNAEPALEQLSHAFYTDQSLFYVRSHGTIPDIDASQYRLRVTGQTLQPSSFSLAEIQAFEHVTIDAVLQCAGNRRADLNAIAPVSGDPWNAGAIGNARWTGARLADVLRACGLQLEHDLHVEFSAADDIEIEGDRFKYAVSIPIKTVESHDVLLAWSMNGEILTREHGFPLRVVVPGLAGVRSPKWLTHIAITESPSTGHMQAKDYKLFPPDSKKGSEDWEHAITINLLPLNSAICEPAANVQVSAGKTAFRGWAMATGSSRVVRVDLSIDNGSSWHVADLVDDGESKWSWTRWHAVLDLPKGQITALVRAWDNAGQSQPSKARDLWNFKGYLSAAWHRRDFFAT